MKISAQVAEQLVLERYEEFDAWRMQKEKEEADREDLELIELFQKEVRLIEED